MGGKAKNGSCYMGNIVKFIDNEKRSKDKAIGYCYS